MFVKVRLFVRVRACVHMKKFMRPQWRKVLRSFVNKIPAISEILRFITELTKARRSEVSSSGVIIIVIITTYCCLLFVFVCCCVSVFRYLAVDSAS